MDGGHSLRLHPGRPPAQPGSPPLHYLGGHAPPDPSPLARPCGASFEKLPLGKGGARRRAWTSLRLAHPRHRRTRAQNPLLLDDRGSRGPVREGAPGGAAQGGRGACRPTRRSALGAGRRPWGTWTPPSGGLLIPRRTTRARGSRGYMPRPWSRSLTLMGAARSAWRWATPAFIRSLAALFASAMAMACLRASMAACWACRAFCWASRSTT